MSEHHQAVLLPKDFSPDQRHLAARLRGDFAASYLLAQRDERLHDMIMDYFGLHYRLADPDFPIDILKQVVEPDAPRWLDVSMPKSHAEVAVNTLKGMVAAQPESITNSIRSTSNRFMESLRRATNLEPRNVFDNRIPIAHQFGKLTIAQDVYFITNGRSLLPEGYSVLRESVLGYSPIRSAAAAALCETTRLELPKVMASEPLTADNYTYLSEVWEAHNPGQQFDPDNVVGLPAA